MTRPLASAPSRMISISLSAVWSPWVSSFSVMTTSAPLAATTLVSRLVESTPRIWVVSMWMDAPSSRYTTVRGFMTRFPVPGPSP